MPSIRRRLLLWLFGCCFSLFALSFTFNIAHAADRYWVGGSDGASFNSASNWASADPGSCTGGGAGVPGTSDVAIFDADCDNGLTIDGTWSVAGFTMNSGYTGTISLGSQNLTVTGAVTIADGTFNAGTGTVTLTGGASTTIDVNSTLTLYNLTLNQTSGVSRSVADNDTLIVTGTLSLTDGSINQTTIPAAGSIAAQGNITVASTFDGLGGRIEITGTANQTFTGGGSTTTGTLPNIEIDKSGGTLTLSGTIRTAANWTWTAGTVDAGSSTVVFAIGGCSNITISGSHTLKNVELAGNCQDYIFAGSTTLTVTGTLTLSGNGRIRQTSVPAAGSISAQGNVTVTSTGFGTGGSGGSDTGMIVFSGSANQTFTGAGSTSAGAVAHITINKSGGTLTLASIIRLIGANWTYTAGTVDPGTSHVVFVLGGCANYTITGSQTFYDLTLTGGCTTATIAASNTITTTGTLTLSGGAVSQTTVPAGGTFSVQGNLVIASGASGGTAAITLAGSNNQTITHSGGTAPSGTVTVNKSAGTATLAADLSVNASGQDLTITSGTLSLGGKNLTVNDVLTVSASGTLQLYGAETITATTKTLSSGSTVKFTGDGDGAADTYTPTSQFSASYKNLTISSTDGATDIFQSGATLIVAGTFFIDTNSAYNLNGQTLTATGMTMSNAGTLKLQGAETLTGFTNATGSGTVEYIGTTTYSSGLNAGDSYYNLVFNGTGGTWILDAALTVNGNMTLTAGTVDVNNTSNYGITVNGSWTDTAAGDQFLERTGTVTFAGGGVINSNEPFYHTTINGSDAIASSNLKGYWKLDTGSGTTATDSSGNSNTGTLNNGPTWSTSVPTLNFSNPYGLDLDGTDDKVTVSDPASGVLDFVNADSFSASLWVNTSSSASPVILNKFSNGQPGYKVEFGSTGRIHFTLGDATTSVAIQSNPGYNNAVWHHVVAVKDKAAGKIRLYIDGASAATEVTDTLSGSHANSNDFIIGAQNNSAFADALVDDARIYNTALTAAQVKALSSGQTDGGYTLGAALDVNGALTLTAGTLDVTTSNYGINVAGNWANGGGTFTGRSGTVTLDGTSQTISGSTTFYNLTKSVTSADTLTMTASTTQTATGTLTLTGTSGNRLSLRSSSTPTQWIINPSNYSIQYVDVKDSNNTGATITCSTGCVNSGNNTNWIFPWLGTVYSDEGSTNVGATATVAMSINGAAAVATDATDASGAWQITLGTDPVAGDVVTLYVDGHASIKAVTVTVTDGLVRSGLDLYQNRLIIRNDNSGSTTSANLNTADNNGDTDISALYAVDGSNVLTTQSGKELLVWSGSTYAPGAAITVDDIDINGTLTLGANAATVTGSWDATGGTFTSSGTVTLTSTTTETITSNSNSFSALTFNGSGGHWNLQDALRVTGAATITAGSLDLNSFNFNNTSGSFSNNGTLRLQGSETLTGFTNDTDSGTTLFDGTGTYSSLSGLTSFYNLTFSGSGATWTQAAAIDVNATLTLTAGTLDASSSSYGITLAGGWTDTGAGAYTERSGTVTLDGTQTINANEAFNSLTVNGTGITVSLGNTLDINGTLTLTTGTLDVTATNYALTVAGNWTNNATFTQRSGTVTLDGTNQTIAGSTTFYNLTKTTAAAATLTFTAGTTQTVTNTWTAQGASGQNLSLRSSSNGTQWAINPQATRTLSFIDVKDSNNTNATVILCTNDCTNSGNNSNWAFPIAITVYSNEGSTTLGANKTIAISVNGGTKTVADTNSSSIASFTTVGLSPGDVVTIWLDDETENGVTVSITNATTLGFSIYQNRLLLQHEQGTGITTANLDTADALGDDDVAAVYSISSSNLTVADSIELFINASDTFTPGGTVTLDDIDINGTFAMNTRNVTVSGSWDATGGTFTGSGTQTTTFDSGSTETITSNGSCFNNITYALATGGSVTNSGALCINGTQTVQAAGSGGGSADTTAPTISDLAVSAGETKATVSWKTSESADSSIDYGTSSSLGTSASDTSQTVWHAIQLTGLTADTTYHYKVTSKDASSNSASSDTNTFTTLKAGTTTDTSAPTISNISASSVTSSGATVAWATSENTIGYTNYGESTSYDRGATPGTNTYTATKTVTLTGLSPATTYHYQITAIDAAGNVGISADQTLATAAEAAVAEAAEVFQAEETRTTADAPKLTSEAPAVTDITGRSVIVSWKTDDKSTSVVYYRLRNTADNPITVGSPSYVTDHAVKVTGLDEGTEYEYSVESKDASGGVLRSKRYQFTTRLPQASKTVIDDITDTTAEFVYETDSATQSIIELTNLLTGETITISEDDLVLQHRIDLNSLDPNTQYQAVILIKGPNGAVAKSLAYIFATREDKIDPIISGIETRSALIEGQRDVVQTIVIWQTDEGSTSQVLYNDGVSQDGKFRHSTDEAKDYVTKHVVVLPDLTPSTVYQYKVKSVDKADNAVESDARVLLTPQRRVSAFDLIIKNLEDTFGWTRQINQ